MAQRKSVQSIGIILPADLPAAITRAATYLVCRERKVLAAGGFDIALPRMRGVVRRALP